MKPERGRLRRILIYCALVVILAALGHLLATRASAFGIPGNDYACFWAAGRLNLFSQNPYDPQQMLALERSVGWPLEDPNLLYNPPWILAIFMPMGLLSYPSSRALWMVFSLVLILVCAAWLWRFYGGSRGRSIVALAAAGIFAPVMLMLVEGQLTPLVLLGLAGFLWYERRQKWLLAGAFGALATIKPQFLLLFWLALFAWVLDQGRWKVLLGAVIAVVAALVVAVAANHGLLAQYFYSFTPWDTSLFPYGRPLPQRRSFVFSSAPTSCGWHGFRPFWE